MSARCACGGSVASGFGECLACAWEGGFDEVAVVTPASLVYGPYAGAVAERVASCADYLGRISRVIASGPSRHYITEKAVELREAAGRLVGTCHDVEAWLGECGQRITHEAEEEREAWFEECVLVAGHKGDHDGDPPLAALSRARGLADDLVTAAVGLADQLGWLSRDRGRGCEPWDAEELAGQVRELRRGLERLSPAVAALVERCGEEQ